MIPLSTYGRDVTALSGSERLQHTASSGLAFVDYQPIRGSAQSLWTLVASCASGECPRGDDFSLCPAAFPRS
jgi:hypothetical protein